MQAGNHEMQPLDVRCALHAPASLEWLHVHLQQRILLTAEVELQALAEVELHVDHQQPDPAAAAGSPKQLVLANLVEAMQ